MTHYWYSLVFIVSGHSSTLAGDIIVSVHGTTMSGAEPVVWGDVSHCHMTDISLTWPYQDCTWALTHHNIHLRMQTIMATNCSPCLARSRSISRWCLQPLSKKSDEIRNQNWNQFFPMVYDVFVILILVRRVWWLVSGWSKDAGQETPPCDWRLLTPTPIITISLYSLFCKHLTLSDNGFWLYWTPPSPRT